MPAFDCCYYYCFHSLSACSLHSLLECCGAHSSKGLPQHSSCLLPAVWQGVGRWYEMRRVIVWVVCGRWGMVLFFYTDPMHSGRNYNLLWKTYHQSKRLIWQNFLVISWPQKSRHSLFVICLPNTGKHPALPTSLIALCFSSITTKEACADFYQKLLKRFLEKFFYFHYPLSKNATWKESKETFKTLHQSLLNSPSLSSTPSLFI